MRDFKGTSLNDRLQNANSFQDTAAVLSVFESPAEARKSYIEFVAQGIALGKRPELVGGGLIRSTGVV